MKYLKPISGNVLIKIIEKTGTIITPESAIREPVRGKIVGVGDKTEVIIDDIVWFDKWVAKEIKIDGETYFVMSERNILVIEEE